MKTAPLRRWLALAGSVAAVLSACGGSLGPGSDGGTGNDGGGADAPICLADPTCAAYCDHLINAGCNWKITLSELRGRCIDDCARELNLIPVDCVSAWANAYACASCGMIQCPQRTCVQDGSVCVEEGLKVLGCDQAGSEYRACAGACIASSLTEGASLSEGSFETTTTGCVCPAALRAGKAAGEACTSSSECAEVCCGCSNSRGRFVIRACKSGRCLGDPGICTDSIGGAQFGAC
jgi:hypothetical protein